MESCIFCRMANGQQPCLKIYDDEYALAFMDIAKDVDGHMLVIPKFHCSSILDCDAELLRHTICAVKTVTNHLVDNCGYDGVDLMNASGEAAGQSLPHFHIHIIPRRKNDGLGGTGEWPVFPGAKCDLTEMWEKLRIK
ncbi:MAG: HIT domain-containing protein [Clostridia bacterium]|nr:HIT domain-containing protein [Clostridia bacterium]